MNKFKKGNVPWNFGKKGMRVSPETEFKVGEMIGDKHYSWKGGIQSPKNDCVYLYDGPNKRKRRPKKIYEDFHGVIPEGWVILHLDNDKTNDSLDNLIAIPRAVLIMVCSGRINRNFKNIEQAVNKFLDDKRIKKS